MSNNNQLIQEYFYLLKNTKLQLGYQALLKFINQIRLDLMTQLPKYQFTKLVVNNLDYAYFQAADQRLTSKGLKIVVVFMHHEGNCQICLSGRNRQVQAKYFPLVRALFDQYELTNNPQKVDYIMRKVISFQSSEVDFSDLQNQINCNVISFIRDVEEWFIQVGE